MEVRVQVGPLPELDTVVVEVRVVRVVVVDVELTSRLMIDVSVTDIVRD